MTKPEPITFFPKRWREACVTTPRLCRFEMVEIRTLADRSSLRTRDHIRPDAVAEYAECFSELPPVLCVRDSKNLQTWLADGRHRVGAAESVGKRKIRAYVVEGTITDARYIAALANVSNTMVRYTSADKRATIRILLADPAVQLLTNREIGQLAGTSHGAVGKIRGPNAKVAAINANAKGLRARMLRDLEDNEGMTAPQLADKYGVSTNTVNMHRRAIRDSAAKRPAMAPQPLPPKMAGLAKQAAPPATPKPKPSKTDRTKSIGELPPIWKADAVLRDVHGEHFETKLLTRYGKGERLRLEMGSKTRLFDLARVDALIKTLQAARAHMKATT